jgi:peptidoglycan/xylan/chitin deacetylase (PgdA/CDA1 family)
MHKGKRDAGSRAAGTSHGDAGNGDAGTRDAGSADPGRDAGTRADAVTRSDAGTGTVIERSLQLTFDDGPEPVKSALNPILKEVKARGVGAAFFVLGEEVKTSRSAVVAIRDAGHVIGNHSWDHMEKGTSTYSDDQVYKEFEDTHAEVKKAGIIMQYWRAPRGDQRQRIQQILTAPTPPGRQLYSMSHCDWQADSDDSKKANTADAMLRAIERDFKAVSPLRIGGGRVWRLLFHVKETTAKALPDVLGELQARGATFVDFSQDS